MLTRLVCGRCAINLISDRCAAQAVNINNSKINRNHSGTYQVLGVHHVDMRSNYGEIFDALRRRRVRNIERHLHIVSNRAEATLERTRQ